MKLSERIFAFVDTETMGLDPEVHEMIEFAVKTSNGKKIHFKIKPQHIETASPRALEINGYSPARWKDAIEPKQAALIIYEWLGDAIIIGQNVKFDIGFIKSLLKKENIYYSRNFLRLSGDTMTLALAHLVPRGLEDLSLKSIMKFLDLEPEPKIHKAMNGADACKTVWDRLTSDNLSHAATINPTGFDDVVWSVRTSNCLRNMKVISFSQLAKWTVPELLKTPNLGKKSLKEIRKVLALKGMHLKNDAVWGNH